MSKCDLTNERGQQGRLERIKLEIELMSLAERLIKALELNRHNTVVNSPAKRMQW